MIHPTAQIHPSSFVDEGAVIGANVRIGPFCYIERDVEIGARTELLSHVVVKGPTSIGEDNRIFQFASIGEACQDLKYKGEPTTLQIGSRNLIRENVTMHRGTVQDAGITRVGDDNLFQIATHIAHDCVVGSNCVFSNSATLAGHVTVKDHAVIGGLTGIHQFCVIGAHSMVGAASMVVKDVPPYVIAQGNHAAPSGVNVVGLKRRGFTLETIRAIRTAYKIIYMRGHSLEEAREQIAVEAKTIPELQLFIDLFDTSERGIVR